ncbi:MAG: PAS domain S-box protein, partial [Ginsengibacter sp.]
KHPQALGISTRQTFSEIWPTIGPMFDGVMQGNPVGFPDFVLQLDRNGYLEECVFDFSYSPIRLEDGEVGGVLVTVIETTEKVRAVNALKESESRFQNLVREANVGIIVLGGEEMRVDVVNEAYGQLIATKPDELLGKPLFDVIPEAEDIFRPLLNKVRQTGEPLYLYDQPYGVTVNGKKIDGYLNVVYQAYRETDGTITGVIALCQNVTETIKNRKEIKEGELRFRRVMQQSPVATTLLKGPEFIVEIANEKALELWGKTAEEIINFPALKVMPELQTQGFGKILREVFISGQPFVANELPVTLNRYGKYETLYINFIYEPLRNNSGVIEGIVGIGIDVTEQVTARKLIEASEQRFSNILSQSLMAIAIFKGPEMVVEFANDPMIAVLGKGNAVLNKPLTEGVPELKDQIFPKLLSDVYNTGLPFEAFETKAVLVRNGITVDAYFNFVYQPYRDVDNTITGITVLATEVTEQVHAKKQIEESEAKFRTLSETIPHMVWAASADGKKNFFNKYFLEYTGLSFEELVGDGWNKIIFPDDLEAELAIWRHNLITGEDFTFEKRVRHHNGTYRWHLCQSIPQKDANGKITGWIGTNTEIDSQKKFADELEAKVKERTYQLHVQNETFKHAEESSMQGSYSFNLTTGKLSYSDNLYGILGYEPKDFEPTLEEFNKLVHPEDLDYVIRATKKVLKNKTANAWNYRMNTRKGEVINIKGTGRVIEFGGDKLLVGTLQDVTKEFELSRELQEKEEYRKQIIHNAPDAVIVIDEKGIITLWNPKTEEIFGWKAEEVIGITLTDTIIPKQYRKAHTEGMKRFLKTGEERILNKTLEMTALNKDGKEFPISLTISQATQQGKNLFIAFLRDITFEKQTKELAISNENLLKANIELETSQKLSEKMLKQKDEFISIASHEMKTPLTTAKGYLELLSLSLKEKDQTALYATKANQAVERLHNLVSELLDASKIQNGQLSYSITTFDFNEMVDEIIDNFQHSAKNHSIKKSGKCERLITGDRGRLQQVLINLFSNAVKYSPTADKVLVEVKELDNNIQLSVQDFGVGISGKHLDKIFDRYYRVQENAIHFQGLGIGLYISHNIIERHNGTMSVISETAKGSTFYFTLPI